MASTVASTELGSASWEGANRYEVGSELHTRAVTFLESVNWDGLVKLASLLCSHCPCELHPEYSIGHFNMVRRITFADGSEWIARLRLPPLPSEPSTAGPEDAARAMQNELSTINCLHLHGIPVPQVYDYCPTSEGWLGKPYIGAPYMLMTYMHGNVATELAEQQGSEDGLFGTPEQDGRFKRQMAQLQVRLASLRFDRIGGLYQKHDDEKFTCDDGDFSVGADPEICKGPWATPFEYYTDIANHAMTIANDHGDEEVKSSRSVRLPDLFPGLMRRYGSNVDTKAQTFGLAHCDFGAHNLLVDEDFNIVGMIDLGNIIAAPVEVIAQLPDLSDLDRPIPGYVETRPAALARLPGVKKRVDAYIDMVADTPCAVEGDEEYGKTLGKVMKSDASFIVQGLNEYVQLQADVSEAWMDAYEMYGKKGHDEEGQKDV